MLILWSLFITFVILTMIYFNYHLSILCLLYVRHHSLYFSGINSIFVNKMINAHTKNKNHGLFILINIIFVPVNIRR